MRNRTRFGGYVFDWHSEQLSTSEGTVHLQPLPTQLLKLFLNRPGDLIERSELYRELWPGRVVDLNQSLNFCIRSLRKSLGDQQDPPTFVETIPRRGYRFVCPVSHEASWSTAKKCAVAGVAVSAMLAAVISATSIQGGLSAKSPSPAQTSYLRALHLLNRVSPELAARSIPLLEEALALDPQHGPSMAALARAHYLAGDAGMEQLDRVRFLNAQALELEPDNAAANTLAGIIAYRHDWDLEAASVAFERALATNPNHPYALYWYPLVLAAGGNLGRALDLIDHFLDTDPGRAQTAAHAGWFYAQNGDWETALRHCLAGIELDPYRRMGLECASSAAWHTGRRDLAVTLLRRLGQTFVPSVPIELDDSESARLDFYRQLLAWYREFDSTNRFEMGRLAMIVGEQDFAWTHVSEMVEQGDPSAPLTLAFSEFAPLREDTLSLARVREVPAGSSAAR